MSELENVLSFAHNYIISRYQRTPEHKKIIRNVYQQLTGKRLSISCSTCYIEAIFTILKLTKMATSTYELKKGYVAMFDIPYKGIKFFTDKELTDELAEEYLRRYPSRAIYFVRLPSAPNEVRNDDLGITIIKPKVKEPEAPADSAIVMPETKGLLDDVRVMTGAEKTVKKTRPKKAK